MLTAPAPWKNHSAPELQSRNPVVSGIRRGGIQFHWPNLSGAPIPALHSAQTLLRFLGQIPVVKNVTFAGRRGMVYLELAFSASPKVVLAEIARRLRQDPGLSGSEPNMPAAMVPLWRRSKVTFWRCGSVFSSWQLKRLAPGQWQACHPLLVHSSNVAAAATSLLLQLEGVGDVRFRRWHQDILISTPKAGTSIETLARALDASLDNTHTLHRFLPPTYAGTALDLAQVASALAVPVLPPLFVLSSGALLLTCYIDQLRQAWRSARHGRCDWNTVVSAVVALTIFQSAYLPAALMSLALRGWRWLEVGSAHRQERAMRRLADNLPNWQRQRIKTSITVARWQSEETAIVAANQAAAPALLIAALGLLLGGPGAALAAVRPDHLSATRSVGRLARLDILLKLTQRGIILSDMRCLSTLAKTREIIPSPEVMISPQEIALLEKEGFTIRSPKEPGAEAMSVYFYLADAPPNHPLPEKSVLCLLGQPSPYIGGTPSLFLPSAKDLIFLCSLARTWKRDTVWSKHIPFSGNAVLTLGGAFLAWPAWAIAIATNLLTASCWARATGLPGLIRSPSASKSLS